MKRLFFLLKERPNTCNAGGYADANVRTLIHVNSGMPIALCRSGWHAEHNAIGQWRTSLMLDELRLVGEVREVDHLLLVIHARWRCWRESTDAWQHSLRHVVASVVAAVVLVWGDGRSQDASRHDVRIAGLLWSCRRQVVVGDMHSRLRLDGVKLVRRGLGDVLSKQCLPPEEVLDSGRDRRQVRGLVLPKQSSGGLSEVVRHVEDDLRVVTRRPFRVARLLAAQDASCKAQCGSSHDGWADRYEFLVVEGNLA